MYFWKIILATAIAGTLLAGEPLITCTPRELRGLPGEPLQLEVAVETDRVVPIRIQIPSTNILQLHSVEKIPIQRTKAGHYIQKRIIIWQGLETGSITLTNLTVCFQGLEKSDTELPTLGIVIDPVEPTQPPEKTEVAK